MMISPADFVKGLIVGFFIGAIFMFLISKGIIPIPFLAC